MSNAVRVILIVSAATRGFSQGQYDLLLQGGHFIDTKNGVSAVRDVAIRDAAVAEHIDPASSFKVVSARGLYLTPGLVDIHVHVYAGAAEAGSYAGDNSQYPDGHLKNPITR